MSRLSIACSRVPLFDCLYPLPRHPSRSTTDQPDDLQHLTILTTIDPTKDKTFDVPLSAIHEESAGALFVCPLVNNKVLSYHRCGMHYLCVSACAHCARPCKCALVCV